MSSRPVLWIWAWSDGKGWDFSGRYKRGLDKRGRLFLFLRRRQSLCVFVFAFPHMKHLLKLRSTLKEIIYFLFAAITKTCLYNFNPLKPNLYRVKRVYRDYTLFFLFLLKNIDCGYSLEPPRRGNSNEYPQSMSWAEIWKISDLSENFQFLVVKFSVYLNRLVFVMRPHFRREAK